MNEQYILRIDFLTNSLLGRPHRAEYIGPFQTYELAHAYGRALRRANTNQRFTFSIEDLNSPTLTKELIHP